MSTQSTALRFAPSTTESDAAQRPGLFRRIFDRFVEARIRHGEAHARAYLSGLTDERLADLGFSPDRIKAIRAKDGAFNSYWL
jgi:uncharacterized protein YjiS (DUF1127 family)